MSYGLTVYSVDLDQLVRACGSRDEALCRAIAERFRGDLDPTEQYFEGEIADGAPTLFEAVRALVLAGVQGWLREAASRNHAIVGFYY